MPSATIVTTGRPVMLMVQPDGTAAAYLQVFPTSGSPTSVSVEVNIQRDGSDIAVYTFRSTGAASSSLGFTDPFTLSFIDTGATAASHVYRVGFKVGSATTNAYVNLLQLVAFEL